MDRKLWTVVIGCLLGLSALASKPWTFWYWMYGQVSDEGIRADLKAMKDAGIGGAYLMTIKHSSAFKPTESIEAFPELTQYPIADQLSPTWWERISTALRVADSLGIEIGIHFSDGFALGGGPWITEDESMQKVVVRDTIVEGFEKARKVSERSDSRLAQEPSHNHIATYIFPAKYYDAKQPVSSVDFPFSSKQPCEIIMSYDEPFTLRSLKVITGGNNIQAHRWKVYASDDRDTWRFVREIQPARRGWQDTDAYSTYSIPATRARYFKFCWNPEGSDPGSEDLDAAKWKPNLKVGNLVLSAEPMIDNYEAKSGAVWRVAEEVNYNDDCYYQLDEFKFTESGNVMMVPNGSELNKQLRSQYYHILTISHASTGHENATGGGGKGLECDKFSRQAIRKQFCNWFGAINAKQKEKGPITRLHVDSWECGSQNWSSNFAKEFKARRGYDIIPWMPLFAGVPMVSREKSESVLRDVRLTIAELINDIFFDEMETLARKNNMKLSCECVSPTMVSDGMLHYQHADYPMGEFWLNSPTHDKPNDMLDAVSGAHVYGKNIVQAEGFTDVRATWDETPAMLKPLLDRMFCMGMNSLVYHVNTHNPWLTLQPGMTLDGIGTFFQRDNTWWPEMRSFNDYVMTCQDKLQKGQPVVDIAVYTGDEIPRRALLPERVVTSLPGLFGEKLIAQEQQRLANEGLPMEVSPVGVNHTRNMTKVDMFTNPLHGYKYDSFNHDALKEAKMVNGELVTKGGMHYKVLVVPQKHKLNPNSINTALDEISELERQGLRIIREPWTESDLTSIGIAPDVVLPEGIDFCHRQVKEQASNAASPVTDIYFLANLTDSAMVFTPLFREAAERKVITLLPHHSAFCTIKEGRIEYDYPLFTSKFKVQSSESSQQLNDDWEVTFEKTGKTIKMATPSDWTTSDDVQVKYYSGHASYRTKFRLKKHTPQNKDAKNSERQMNIVLDLGNVHDVATVYVNGIDCGTAWMAPYVVDITKAVKKGKNELRIDVANTWNNALLGNDLGTPPFANIWTNGKYRRAEKDLLPAGLLSQPVIFVKSEK